MDINEIKAIKRDDGKEKAGILIELKNGLFYVCELIVVTSIEKLANDRYQEIVNID